MDIKLGDFKPTAEQKRIVNEIINTGRLTEGKYVKKFETETAKFLGISDVVAVSNGTVALQLIAHLIRHKYPKAKTVCVPATTFPATLNAFEVCGFKTMLCDIEPDTLCIDINTLTHRQKKKIDVIVPVHLMGYTCDMDTIMAEAAKYRWIVIEDFAEAFGSFYDDRCVGTIGHYSTCSFYVSHILQGGELGMVTAKNPDDIEILRSMKNHGRIGDPMQFKHGFIGSNYKTTEFCAGICYAQMKTAETYIQRRCDNVKYIFDNVKNDKLKMMPVEPQYSFLGYPIRASLIIHRLMACKKLNDAGIETRGMFPCLANQPAYKGKFKGYYTVSNRAEDRCFYIPCHQYLKKSDLKRIVKVLNDY